MSLERSVKWCEHHSWHMRKPNQTSVLLSCIVMGMGHVSEAAHEQVPPVRRCYWRPVCSQSVVWGSEAEPVASERVAAGNPAHAMLPPSDDTEWLPSPCHLLSLELQGMTSPLIIVNINWDDDRCRKITHGSLKASRTLCCWASAGFLAGTFIINTEKNILEHSASAGQGTAWSIGVHLTPVSRNLLISEADSEADVVIFLSIHSSILFLPWLLARAFFQIPKLYIRESPLSVKVVVHKYRFIFRKQYSFHNN